jgi:hypothetical protein
MSLTFIIKFKNIINLFNITIDLCYFWYYNIIIDQQFQLIVNC